MARVLLDESLPRQLAGMLPGHAVETVPKMGWAGTSNGELLRRASAEGFDALVTGDQGIEYQQSLTGLALALVVLRAPSNRLSDLTPPAPRLLQRLQSLTPGSIEHIDA